MNTDNELTGYEVKPYETFWDKRFKLIIKQQESGIVSSFIKGAHGWIVDVGCGDGRFVDVVRGCADKAVFVDLTYENLMRLKEKFFYEDIYLIAADANNLPFKENVFSFCLSTRTINNNPNFKQFLGEVSRIINPGGLIALSYFNRRSLLRIFKHGMSCFQKVHEYTHTATFGNMYGTHPSYFKSSLADAGLIIIRKRGVGFSYQVFNYFKHLGEFMENNRLIERLAIFITKPIDWIFEKFDLALWQFVLLEKKGTYNNQKINDEIEKMFRCPKCKNEYLLYNDDCVRCNNCSQVYPIRDGIYDFRLVNKIIG